MVRKTRKLTFATRTEKHPTQHECEESLVFSSLLRRLWALAALETQQRVSESATDSRKIRERKRKKKLFSSLIIFFLFFKGESCRRR
jgi:hypothetical protein